MQLSTEAKDMIRESFMDTRNGTTPEYSDIIEREFEFQEIVDLVVQECTKIIDLMDNMALMVFSAISMLFDTAAGQLEPGDLKSTNPIGIAASQAHMILDKQPKHIKDKYLDISNFFYSVVFGMIKDNTDILDLGHKINGIVEHAYKVKKEGITIIRRLKEEDKLDFEHPEKFFNIENSVKYKVNHHLGLSVILMAIVGTFVSSMSQHLMERRSGDI